MECIRPLGQCRRPHSWPWRWLSSSRSQQTRTSKVGYFPYIKKHLAQLTEKEYIFQIRSFIAEAKEPHPVNSDKFFDSVRFWQQAYEKSEAEQSKLLDRIYELEQRNTALVSKEQKAGQDEKTAESSKRKANPNGGANKKRAKTQTSKQAAASKPTSVQGGIDILEIVEYKEESELDISGLVSLC